ARGGKPRPWLELSAYAQSGTLELCARATAPWVRPFGGNGRPGAPTPAEPLVSTDINVLGDDRIGGYRYVRTLFRGQNAIVMEVVHESTGRHLVMKELLPTRSNDSFERKLFAFEAKLGQELRHPNLIRVHEYQKSSDQPYFVMDYFPSITLR